MKYHKTFVIVPITAWILISSCERQQDLCFDHDAHLRRPIDIVFDWSDCPGANPSSMSLYLFPSDGTHYTRHEFVGRKGGQIYIAPGVYTAIALNSDNESVRVNNAGSAEEFTITLRDNSDSQGASALQKDERISQAPDSLWISYLEEVKITGPPVKVPMKDACCHYSIEIRNLHNSKLVRSIDTTLGGMHGSMNFCRSPNSDTKLHFTMEVEESGSVKGSFLTFGHCGYSRSEENQTEHNVDFYFTLGDGSVRFCSRNVTKIIHGQHTEKCHIIIDSLAVPEQTSGDMNITVDDWNVVNIDVSTN